MKNNDLIARYLDGLTSPEEERQLRDALEAKALLSGDERAVLELLSLSYPEEDTATLLAEDLSADFDAMTAKRIGSLPLRGNLEGSSLFTWHFAAILSVAAVLLIVFLVWPESHKETMTQPEAQPVVAEAEQQPATPLSVEERQEELLAEVPPTPQPAKKRRKTAGKQSTTVEPVPAEAEPAEETLPVEVMEAYAMTVEPTHDAYADIEAEMRDIRSRGERFEAMVAEFTRSY